MFDLERHHTRPEWETIRSALAAYFATRYRDNKYDLKRDYFTRKGGAARVDEIRRNPPPNLEPAEWKKYVNQYMTEKAQTRSTVNKENRKKNKILSRHGSKSFAASRQEYVRHILFL